MPLIVITAASPVLLAALAIGARAGPGRQARHMYRTAPDPAPRTTDREQEK